MKDPVTKETYQLVMARDAEKLHWWASSTKTIKTAFGTIVMPKRPICLAPMLDPATSGTCYGHSTLDHVKDKPRMGKRAPSDPQHLVTLCYHHHLDGWATSHRPLLREYLRTLYP